MKPKEKIRRLVKEAKIKEALQCFLESLSPKDTVSQNDLLLLSSRLATLEEQIFKNIIRSDDVNMERARIDNALLSFVDSWSSGDGKSEMDAAIAALPIGKDAELGLIQLVNCDRRQPVRKFNRAYEEKKEAKQPFQFYFLCGCPDETPGSLAERILYEIIEKEGLDVNSSVHYLFKEGDFKRVKIENLPLGIDVGGSKKKFKEYVQKRFAFANSESFEAFIETGVPKLPYKFVFTVFTLPEIEWEDAEDEIILYLQWMADTFQTAHSSVPTFLFLFVFHFERLYDPLAVRPNNAAIVKRLEEFCLKNSSPLFSEIVPVKKTHVTGWLENLGVRSPNDYKDLIDAWNEKLKDADRPVIDNELHFHMMDVEKVQKQVVETFRDKYKVV